MSLLGRLDRPLAWVAGRRLRQLEAVWRDPLPVQARTLRALVGRARDTVWGREHGFRDIRGIADYQRQVPVTTYLDVRLLVERTIGGERDVLWPGRPAEYCKTSGTTAGDKYIPVTREAFRAHRHGGVDALLLALRRVGRAEVLDGPMLFLVAPGPSRSDAMPRWATSRDSPRGGCPHGSGSDTRQGRRSLPSRIGSSVWRPPRGSRATRTSG
jgi:GH3 auxin-responsive promoter